MERRMQPLSARAIVMLLLVIPVATLLALVLSTLVLGIQWPPDPSALVASLIGPAIIVGFIIYGANLRDERTIQISNKAARNGFLSIFYAIPLVFLVFSVAGFSAEIVLPLLAVGIVVVASASISALYYYRR